MIDIPLRKRWPGRTPWFLIPFLALSLELCAQEDQVAERIDRMVAEVTSQMRALQVPGVAFGILHQGRFHTKGLGITSLDNPLPVDPDTLFQTGSISKTYTGTLIMTLVEQGKIDLDVPVTTWLPEFRVADQTVSAQVTMRTLLTHMGGFEGDFFVDTGNGDDALERIVARMPTLQQIAPLGRCWSYNNAGFYVAGRIVEVVTGTTLEEAMHERLFVPIGLEQTHLFPAEVMTKRFAVGHAGPVGRMSVLSPWALPRSAHGVGGVVANILDLLRYGQFHLGDGSTQAGGRVLNESTLRSMHGTQVVKEGIGDGMALSWHVSEEGGVRQLSHGGSTNGQQASLTLVPSEGFAIAFLTNSNRGGRLARNVTRLALRDWFEVVIEDPTPTDSQPEDLQDFIGRYERSFADVLITRDGDGLLLQPVRKQGFPHARAKIPAPDPPAPVRFCAEDRVVFVDGTARGTTAEFIRGEDGHIGWVRVGGRLHKRIESEATDR